MAGNKTQQAPPADTFGFYTLMRHFSLDVVAGAVGSSFFASRVIREDLPPAWYVILGCSVWLIYTLDHLIDARRMGPLAQTARHRLHHRIFWPLTVLWAVVFLAALATAILVLPWSLMQSGFIVGGMACAHLFLVLVVGRKMAPGLTKEVGVAIVYTTGMWLPVIQMRQSSLPLWNWLIVAMFFLLACANLLLLSVYEKKSDEADQQTNIANWAGEKTTRRVIQLILGLALILGAAVLYLRFDLIALASVTILTVICVAHFQILFFPEFFRPRERYRAWGDLSFCFTWLILLV